MTKSNKSQTKFSKFFKSYRWWLLSAVVIIALILLFSGNKHNSQKDYEEPSNPVSEVDSFFAPSFGPEGDDSIPFSDEIVIDSPPIN